MPVSEMHGSEYYFAWYYVIQEPYSEGTQDQPTSIDLPVE